MINKLINKVLKKLFIYYELDLRCGILKLTHSTQKTSTTQNIFLNTA